ncbi:MAG: 2-C-methyl-D-erythritol 4-phosphate cytidylyltransferase [Fimbriimonadaceae bacterium]|nr:2-C-methyl-D-erythritol 4-phosphate cytidylyltransferase [Fimbriimonadaceae bacterium]
MKAYAAILAAGRGTRFGRDKTAARLAGRPIWQWSAAAFAESEAFAGIVLVGNPDNLDALRGFPAVARTVGGDTRSDSTLAALDALPDDATHIAIHDAARPLVSSETIERVALAAQRDGAAAAAVPVVDTIRQTHADGSISLPREALVAMQTPQMARVDWLREAFRHAASSGAAFTDEVSLLDAAGFRTTLVPGNPENFKVTLPQDLARARTLLGAADVRTGFGYDIHRFATDPTRELWLGGRHFPGEVGLDGHSDADVLLHAICDALLGAASLGDIGVHFSNRDERWRGIRSTVLLAEVARMLAADGWAIRHVDAAMVAERPRVMPHAGEIRGVIANTLSIPVARVSLKATTHEGLGALGRGEGIAAWAVATIAEAD